MRSISTKKVQAACIVCALSSALLGGSFTNHAGHVVSGDLSAISNNVVVISGRKYPFSIFPENERARMRALLAVPEPLPPSLVALRKSLRERVLRINALEAAGAKDKDSAAAARAKLQSIWTRALEGDQALTPATRSRFREL